MRDPQMSRLDATSVLAVCAHPDDESFGLGAVLSTCAASSIQTHLLCFTHGEASTLGADADLAVVRERELTDAVAALEVRSLRLRAHADGRLSEVGLDELCRDIAETVSAEAIDCLLVFDEGGITGHPDHQRATEAALQVGEQLGIPVLAWTLPDSVASALKDEFGAGFVGRRPSEIDIVLEVDRERQHRAIACHASQATDNPVLRRRLALQGSTESLRWLRAPAVAG